MKILLTSGVYHIQVLKYRHLPERRPGIPESLYAALLPCYLRNAERRPQFEDIESLIEEALVECDNKGSVYGLQASENYKLQGIV